MFDLYLITPERSAKEIAHCVRAALQKPPRVHVAVQMRAKHLSAREQHGLALQLRALTSALGVSLFINDRIDVALSSGADGVHLPEHGLPLEAARGLLPASMRVGVSCHDLQGLQHAADGGAHFATLSPVLEVPHKGPALGMDAFAALVRNAHLPVVALGGVGAEHIGQLRLRGARSVALIRAVFDADDPARALWACEEAWLSHRAPAGS